MKELPIDVRYLEVCAANQAALDEMTPEMRQQLAEWALKQARRKQKSGKPDTTVHFEHQGGRLVAVALDLYHDDENGTPRVCLPHPAWGKCQPREGEEWTVVCAGESVDGFVWILPVFNSRWN